MHLVNGKAVLPASLLTRGKYTLTALYNGDSNYNASKSTALAAATAGTPRNEVFLETGLCIILTAPGFRAGQAADRRVSTLLIGRYTHWERTAMTEPRTQTLDVPGATLCYDVRAPASESAEPPQRPQQKCI